MDWVANSRRIALLTFASWIIVGCVGSGDSADGTVPLPPQVTTSKPPATSSTLTPTTTTTTTDTETTTLAVVPDAGALVATETWVLGWWMNDAWHDDAEHAELKGTESFVTYSIGHASTNETAIGLEPYCDVHGPADATPRLLFGSTVDGIAVSTSLSTTPGVAVPIEADEGLLALASDLLADREIEPTTPVIVQAFRTDIDHDGVPERIMVIDRNAAGYPSIGDHSIVVLVQGVGDDTESTVIVEDTVTELASDSPNDLDNWFYTGIQHRIKAIADVNGDGVDEVYVSWIQYEEWGDALYEWNPNTSQWANVLAKECQI